MKQRRLKLVVLVLLLGLLVACSSEVPEEALKAQEGPVVIPIDPVQPSQAPLNVYNIFYKLKKVHLTGFFTPPVQNCVSNEFSMPGQGGRMSGSTGGLSYNTITTPSTTAQNEGLRLRNNFFTTFTPTQTTVVLVADDFGPTTQPRFTLPDTVFAATSTNATLAELQRTGQLTHGPLVLEHLTNVVTGTSLYDAPAVSLSGAVRKFPSVTGTTQLRIEGINIRNTSNPLYSSLGGRSKAKITTQDVVNALLPRLIAVTTPVIINMSFVFVPCDLEEDFLRWEASLAGTQTFDDYIERLAFMNSAARATDASFVPYWTDHNGFIDTPDIVSNGVVVRKGEVTLINELIEITNGTNGTPYNFTDDDPLLKLIRDHATESATQNIYVASSGNYGLNRSMYPAAWSGVINVTGSAENKVPVGMIADLINERAFRATTRVDTNGDGVLDKTITFFNQGEVMPVGATFSLTRNNRTIHYMGTSYSTPLVSAYSALDAAGVFRCAETGTPFKSQLAMDTVALTDRPLETLGSTTGAVQARCGAN